ncbi:MAG TPA: dihydroneopterin aldolase [Lacisediminihabitans sp.]|uniref:dihydroneopterin aldolase n=1 Tax=Lacisediminihabitans sp. TaxID=2787631 RepID=UPI002EDA666D
MTDNDTIRLTGLRVFAHHGVLEEERVHGQEFVIDVTLGLDLEAAAVSDDVRQTVHYGILADEIAAAVGTDPVDLIETVAKRVADLVLGHEAVRVVTVTVHKPSAPIAVAFDDVSVTITRERA